MTRFAQEIHPMSEPTRIDTEAFYSDQLAAKVGLSPSAMARARKAGELRFTRRGGRVLYLGAWIYEWLTADEDATPRNREAIGA